jgi:hypothetical protein
MAARVGAAATTAGEAICPIWAQLKKNLKISYLQRGLCNAQKTHKHFWAKSVSPLNSYCCSLTSVAVDLYSGLKVVDLSV